MLKCGKSHIPFVQRKQMWEVLSVLGKPKDLVFLIDSKTKVRNIYVMRHT